MMDRIAVARELVQTAKRLAATTDGYDILSQLADSGKGWKKMRKPISDYGIVKRFGMVWVRAEVDFGYSARNTVWIHAKYPKGLPFEQWDAFKDATSKNVDVSSAAEVEKHAATIADAAKSFVPKRERKPRDEFVTGTFEWRNEEGKNALKKWKKYVADLIVDDMLTPAMERFRENMSYGIRRGEPDVKTKDITFDLLGGNWNVIAGTNLMKDEGRKLILGILKSLERQRKIRRTRKGYWSVY